MCLPLVSACQWPLVADSSYELNFEIVEHYCMRFLVKRPKGENHPSLSFVEAKTRAEQPFIHVQAVVDVMYLFI